VFSIDAQPVIVIQDALNVDEILRRANTIFENGPLVNNLEISPENILLEVAAINTDELTYV